MGGLRARMKMTFWVYLIGALALAGIAPLAGFFSKDEILAGRQPVPARGVRPAGHRRFPDRLLHGPPGAAWSSSARPRTEPAAKPRENPPVMTVPAGDPGGPLGRSAGCSTCPGCRAWNSGWSIPWAPSRLQRSSCRWSLRDRWRWRCSGFYLGWYVYGRRPLKRGQPDPLQVQPGPGLHRHEPQMVRGRVLQRHPRRAATSGCAAVLAEGGGPGVHRCASGTAWAPAPGLSRPACAGSRTVSSARMPWWCSWAWLSLLGYLIFQR